MNEDKIIKMLLKHDEDIAYIKENMATKKDFEPIVKTQDQILVILKRLDGERVVNNHRITNLEDKTEKYDKDIAKIKVNLKMA